MATSAYTLTGSEFPPLPRTLPSRPGQPPIPRCDRSWLKLLLDHKIRKLHNSKQEREAHSRTGPRQTNAGPTASSAVQLVRTLTPAAQRAPGQFATVAILL